jgi:hypothetical protein
MFLYHKYRKDSYLYDLHKIYYLLTLKVSNENIHNHNIYVVKLFYHKTLIKTLNPDNMTSLDTKFGF